MSERHITESIQAAVQAVEGQATEVKAAVGAAAATAAIPPPTPAEAGGLWRLLVGGLVIILIGALVGIILTVTDGKNSTSPDVIVTVFASVLTGLIGLFVKSPSS